MLKKVCVAFDGSENAYRAFDFALDLYKACTGAAIDISVLSVVVPPEIANVEADVKLGTLLDTMTGQFDALHQGLKEKAKAANAEVKAETRVGHAAEEIIKYINENKCDMVVMGQKGKSGIEEFLLGSVSRRVARHATCTVTIIK